jgi:hypothetical protein
MQFNGFEVIPCGNAVLTISNGILTVSGISNSGLDGVLINVAGNSSYTVNFGQLPNIKANNGVLKCSLLSKNTFGQVTPSWEIFKWYDSVSDKIITGYNGTFLPSSYNIFGKLGGASVFDINNGVITTSPDPDFPPPSGIWPLIIAAAAVVATVFAATYSKTTTTVTKTYDANGKFTGCTHTVTTDPVPFDIEVNGTTYTVDEYGLKFDSTVPTSLIGLPSIETSPLAEMITGTNLSSFEILSIV